MKEVRVKCEVRYFVECPECGDDHDVDSHEIAVIACECGCTFEYDNTNPDRAEVV